MAFSSAKKTRSDAGNVILEVWSFNAASVTTGTISPGVSNVLSVLINNETSGAVSGQKAVAATSGLITLTGLNSNDVGTITVIGY
jgi:hypothetical protein